MYKITPLVHSFVYPFVTSSKNVNRNSYMIPIQLKRAPKWVDDGISSIALIQQKQQNKTRLSLIDSVGKFSWFYMCLIVEIIGNLKWVLSGFMFSYCRYSNQVWLILQLLVSLIELYPFLKFASFYWFSIEFGSLWLVFFSCCY